MGNNVNAANRIIDSIILLQVKQSELFSLHYVGNNMCWCYILASAWATAAKTHTNKIDKVQNMGLITTLGAMKSTPIATMHKTAGVEHLDSRRNAKLLLIQGEKG